jgi:hypothetical protein
MATVQSALDDALARALAERDALTFAALHAINKFLPTAVASQTIPSVTGLAPFRASGDGSAGGCDSRGRNRTTASGGHGDWVEDTIARAAAERDGRLWAALQVARPFLPPALGRSAVPDVSGMPPFRGGDSAAGACDSRGVNRTS